MIFFMNGPNILRLIIILSIIIFFRAHYSFIFLSHPKISSRTSLQGHILQGIFMILCPNSSWSLALHLKLESGCKTIYVVLSHIGYVYMLHVLLAYINRHFLYIIRMIQYTILFSTMLNMFLKCKNKNKI